MSLQEERRQEVVYSREGEGGRERLTPTHSPVEGRHAADGQQQVEQALGRLGQGPVLLQQVAQRAELLTGQLVENHRVPDGKTSQEAMREEAHHPADSSPPEPGVCV